MNHTLILFGGSSGERMVSVASAQNIVSQFQFDEIVFLTQTGKVHLVSKNELLGHSNPFLNEFRASSPALANSLSEGISFFKDKTVFLALHGTEGEDGQLQKLFEKNKIAYTASDSTSSANSFHKEISKKIVSKANIKTTDELFVSAQLDTSTQRNIFDFFKTQKKIVLKPIANGSSIGLFIVDEQKKLEQALEKIKNSNFGDYLAEKFIEGRELTVGVYQTESGLNALPPSEVLLNVGHSFDYEGKYLGRGSKEITPADLTQDEISVAQNMALESHKALKCFGYSRTDMILTASGPVYLETNTLPGLSKASFVPQQLHVAKISFSDFIKNQLEMAEKRQF